MEPFVPDAKDPWDNQAVRVETTLYILMSVDGKITSGESDTLDSDRDWKRIRWVKEGLHQYYDLERSLAINSLNTGRVMEKIGLNTRIEKPNKDERLTFFIVDRKPHLNENGLRTLAQWVGRLFIVTNNPEHPAMILESTIQNIQVIFYPGEVDFQDLFVQIKQKYGIKHLIIESGGTLNSVLVRQGLVDHVWIMVAPLLVGGINTSSLMDGLSLQSEDELINLKALKLIRCEILENSYLRLEYDVVKDTEIDPVVTVAK